MNNHMTLRPLMILLTLCLAVGCESSTSTDEGLGTILPASPGGNVLDGGFGGSGSIPGTEGGESTVNTEGGAGGEGIGFGEGGGEGEEVTVDPTLDTDSDQIFDINDNCPQISNPGQEDFDDDGIGNVCDTDLDGDGMSNLDDCAPFDDTIHKNAPELCNGKDDNCNDQIDEDPDEACVIFYPDNDGDGSGAVGQGLCLCNPTESHPTPFGGDCNDTTALVSSFAEEACDDQDNNCNNLIDEGCDDDQDGYCDLSMFVVGSPAVCPNGPGDCIDFSADIFPGAEEITGDGFDNNCDGIAPGDGGEIFEVVCPDDCLAIADKTQSYLCALGMCFDQYIQSATFSSPSNDTINTAYAVVNHFGSPSNDLAPFEGSSYGLLASGPAEGTSHSSDLSGGSSVPDPFSPDGYETYDNVEFTVEMIAPPGAVGFSIDYVFFSVEYEEYIGTSFNDKFYMQLTAPVTTGGEKKVINTTQCSNENSYHDIIDENGNKLCYIAINTAFSEKCPNVPTDISGTGFECTSDPAFGSSSDGSSTGWLTTSWPIQAGEAFTLTFHVHDTSDGIYDSEVILDNFRFETIPGEFSQGTTTAN